MDEPELWNINPATDDDHLGWHELRMFIDPYAKIPLPPDHIVSPVGKTAVLTGSMIIHGKTRFYVRYFFENHLDAVEFKLRNA